MSGCAVSNRFFWNRSLFYLSMPLLAAALVLAPVAEAQDTPTFEGATVSDQMYSAGVVIEALELPAASGGNGDLTYDLRPVPPGLAFDAASRTLSGTPSEIAIFLMTYEVADADGVTATLTFNILVEEEDVEPTFEGATVSDQMYSAGVVIEALELPAASGGNGDLTYDLRPVPPGLAFDAASRTLSGTPSEVAISLMTYEVTDADGDTATLTFEIEVDTMPTFEGATVPDQSYRTGDDIGVLELPSASVGEYEEPPRYSLSPEVPGLTFDAASLTLSGTPTVAGTYEMIYRVEDSDTNVEESDAEELTFIVYVELTFAAVTARQTTFTAGEEIKQPWELPVGRSTDALTYTLIGALPPGLVFDPASRTISGMPPADFLYDESYPFTYRAVDSDGDSAELSFTIVVNGMPSFGDQVVEDQMYTAGDEVSLGLPEASGGNVKLTYSLDGALPPGLMFDAEARTISGMPPADFLYDEKYAFTYRVTDVDGDESAPLPFTIVVDGKPSFDGKTVEVPQEPYQTDVAMSLTLPEPTGGNVIWEYRLKGELPPGLEFDDDPAKREISGTPPPEVVYAESYALTLEVWDADGDFAELPFTIVVDGMPSFGDDKTVDAKPSYPAGEEMSLTLPDADGGNVELTYSLSGNQTSELSFLKFDAATRTLSGTPSAYRLYKAEYLLTLVVKDADEDEATLDFTIVVNGKPSFSGRVANQMYTAGTGNVETLELPKAAGGNVELTYTLDGELPGELEFDAATRTISGMLPQDVLYAAKAYVLTYGVSDVDGDAVTLNFTIAVNGIPSFVREAEDQQYPAGEAVSLELPAAVGGNVALTYRLDGVLPSGLTFDPATRTLSGTPPEYASYAAEGYGLTYRVADVDGEEPAPLEFTLRVNGMPRFDETVSRQVTFAEGQTIDPWVLPSASGGNGQLTYALVGPLPEGLTYDAASRTLSGTLSADATYAAESEGYALEYSVQDQDGEGPAPLSFTLVVHGMPSFGTQVVADQSYEAGEAVDLSLPAAAGGNGALTYRLDGVLPPGLAFDADSAPPTLSGMLPADATYAEGYGLTYGVSDVDGDAVTLNFTIAVNGIPSFVREAEDQQYPAGEAVSLELPAAVGGNVALTYRLDGDLPPGLAFNPTSRTLSGELSPNVSYSPEGYGLTYRVADVDGEEPEPLTFTIAVNGMPFFEGTITNQRVPEGEEIAPLELPAALGGNGDLTYSLNEENLPPGLVFDAEARTLSGTPELHVSHPAEGYELTYRVEDEDGDSAELSFFLTVDGTPTFFDATIEDRILRQNEAMDSWELPAASGGNGDLTYSLDMNVPGLNFDAASRTLSGTPTHTGVYRLVYQVEDIDGDSAELTFHITVDGAPNFSGDVANQTYIEGEAIEDLVLPLASGGNLLSLNPDDEAVFGELMYTLDNVPPGLTFDPNPMSPMLSGTPTEVGTYTLTYTAHDADDNMTAEDAAILSFEVRVEESATDRFAELNEQILSKYALAIADGTNRSIENRLEQMDRVGDVNKSFSFAAESTLHDMIQSGRIFENRPVNLSQVVNGSSFAVPFGFGRGCIVCPGSPTFWGRGDYGRMSSDDGSLDWDGNLTRAQIGLDARPGAEMLTGLALSWANGSFDYTAPLLGEERVDGTYTTRMLSLHPYVGFSPGRLGVWLTAGLGRGNLDIDDEQGTVGQQSSDTSLRTASVGASGDLLASGPTQLRIKAAATVAQVEVEGGAVENGKGNRIAEQTVSANRLRLALKGSHAYEAGMDGQVTPELEVALRQDGGDGQTGAGVEVGGGLRYEGGGFTLAAMARSLVSDGDDEVEYKEWGAHLLLQRSAGTGGRGLSLRVMPTYGTQANSLTLWERSVAEIADRGTVNAQGQLRAEVGYGLAAPGGRGLYTVYSGMTQAPAQMQLRLGTRFEVDSSLSVSLESTRWQRMASTAEHGLLLRGRLVF